MICAASARARSKMPLAAFSISFIEKAANPIGASADLTRPIAQNPKTETRNPNQIRTLNHHFLFAAAPGDDDFPGVLEAANNIDNLLLRRLHIAHPHRAH